MPLGNISLRIDALGKNLDEVDELVEGIVHDAGSHAAVSVGIYRTGGYTEVDKTPDGKRTRLVLGEEVSTECIIYIEGVQQSLVRSIREELSAVFLIKDEDFYANVDDLATMGDEEPMDDLGLDDPDGWNS